MLLFARWLLAAGCWHCNLFVLIARAGCWRGARVDGDAAACVMKDTELERERERVREREREVRGAAGAAHVLMATPPRRAAEWGRERERRTC